MAKRTPQTAPPSPHHQHEIVDPRWLLKAGAVSILVALLLAYLTLCWLFYHGQWQFALHPSRTVAQTPPALSLKFEPVRFGVDAIRTMELIDATYVAAGLPIRQPTPVDPASPNAPFFVTMSPTFTSMRCMWP